MGYYTCYILSVHDYGGSKISDGEIAAKILELYNGPVKPDREERFYPFCRGRMITAPSSIECRVLSDNQDGLNLDPEDHFKWYDADRDMLELSKIFPDIIFRLRGQGDDSDDKWETYYNDGRLHTYNITGKKKAKFDIADLEPPAKPKASPRHKPHARHKTDNKGE